MSGKLLLFCGIPGSGKTTIARLVAKNYPGSVHIQTDIIRAMITQPNFNMEESELVYQACVAAAKEALGTGRLVILDATFGTKRRRESTLSALARHYSSADVVHVKCDLEVALRRNFARPNGAAVPEASVRSIHSMFEAPEEAITVDATTTEPPAAARTILQAIIGSAA